MKESAFQKKLTKLLEAKGAWVLNVHGSNFQRSGVPDLRIDHLRFKGWLELKVGRNQPSLIQKRNIRRLLINDSYACVARYVNGHIAFEHNELVFYRCDFSDIIGDLVISAAKLALVRV